MSLRGRPISKNPNKCIIYVHAIHTIQKSKIKCRTKYVSICVLISILLHNKGKSFSEALFLESVKPQYDKRLFIEFPERYMLCTNIVLNVKTKKQLLYITSCEPVFFGEFNEQSLVILLLNWGKNEGFWKRFTCIS